MKPDAVEKRARCAHRALCTTGPESNVRTSSSSSLPEALHEVQAEKQGRSLLFTELS